MPIFLSFQNQNDLDNATLGIVDSLRRAHAYSRSSKGDSSWGVFINTGESTFFKGASYATRDPSYDETTDIPDFATVTVPTEVVFAKFTGTPSIFGFIFLTGNFTTRYVTLSGQGVVGYL